MNAKLRKLPDGSGRTSRNEVCWFTRLVVSTDGTTHGVDDFGEIYWPFALYLVVGFEDTWSVLHLPSGYAVQHGMTRRRARGLIDQLRRLDVDWSFTRPNSAKWDRAKAPAAAVVKKFNSGRAAQAARR